GLDNLKDWLKKRGRGFDKSAKEFGLETPKGILLLGIPGTGKSLTAKAIGSEWQFPLLRLDMGKIFGGIVGESEENIRGALNIAEAIAPSILWIDEIEKGFAGAGGSGGSDSGVTKRIFGTFITWMQEKTNPVFIIATANSIENLPPELLRKGRFDEIFFVDLPTRNEIETIFKIHISKRNRDPKQFDMNTLCELANGFSGAEIEQAVISALYDVYYDGKRELKTEDLAKSLNETVPLSVTMGEKIGHLREWASTRARNAT
ncbi:AAA family ATPase, partial [bacterium]|nr:AAA family ATPase [bacterium]